MKRNGGERKRKGRRLQTGTFHVIINSNYQVSIFWNKEDKTKFLTIFFDTAEKYLVKIHAYCLMDTHIHLMVTANGNLTAFMGICTQLFSTYYNRKYKRFHNNLFRKGFESYPLYKSSQVSDAAFYFFYNPLAEGICKHPKQYKDCSYAYLFRKNNKQIDTSIIEKSFEGLTDFDNRFFKYVEEKSVIVKSPGKDGRMTASLVDDQGKSILAPPAEGNGSGVNDRPKNTDEQILAYVKKELNGRTLYSLTRNEIDDMIGKLLTETWANYRQISSALAVSYHHVCDFAKMRAQHFLPKSHILKDL
ncbi:MAG: transposase [Bacteroidales bacterium]|nr:transposase [Bacteroidales bacterium]MCI2144877.1 transposase [Bacteroidales bacterium]